MDSRLPTNTAIDNNFENEFGEISSRVRKVFEGLIPEDCEMAAMVVRETPPESDELLEIEEPIWNPHTSEILETGDESELMQALEELYLAFPQHIGPRRPAKSCWSHSRAASEASGPCLDIRRRAKVVEMCPSNMLWLQIRSCQLKTLHSCAPIRLQSNQILDMNT